MLTARRIGVNPRDVEGGRYILPSPFYVSSAELPCDRGSDLGRPPLDLLLIPALEHHAQQRLGSRVAHQQPPLAGELSLDALHHRRDRRNRSEIPPSPDANVR